MPQVPGVHILDLPPFPTAHPPASNLAVYGGVIAEPGDYAASIRVTDSVGTTFDRAFTVTVTPLALRSHSPLPHATVGVPYTFPFEVSGGDNYLWTATGLPAGVSLNSATGELTGAPTTAGSPSLFVTVLDQVTQRSTSGSFTLPISAFAIVTNGVLPSGVVGSAYSQPLSAPGCAATCTWSSGGGLPGGMTLSPAGLLSGTPTGTFTGTFSITASSSSTGSSTRQLLVILSPTFPALAIVTASFNDLVVHSMTSNFLNAQGGAPPYTWTLESGALPTGVSLVGSGERSSAVLGPALPTSEGARSSRGPTPSRCA